MSNANGPFRCVGCGEEIEWDPEARIYARTGCVGTSVTICQQSQPHAPDGKGPIKFESIEDVGQFIDRRSQVYGEPVEIYRRVAEVWSGILGVHVNPVEVPLCMIGLKLVRAQQAPDYSDNTDDVEGYLDIARKIVGDDMIDARSVTEYIEKKWSGDNAARL